MKYFLATLLVLISTVSLAIPAITYKFTNNSESSVSMIYFSYWAALPIDDGRIFCSPDSLDKPIAKGETYVVTCKLGSNFVNELPLPNLKLQLLWSDGINQPTTCGNGIYFHAYTSDQNELQNWSLENASCKFLGYS